MKDLNTYTTSLLIVIFVFGYTYHFLKNAQRWVLQTTIFTPKWLFPHGNIEKVHENGLFQPGNIAISRQNVHFHMETYRKYMKMDCSNPATSPNHAKMAISTRKHTESTKKWIIPIRQHRHIAPKCPFPSN